MANHTIEINGVNFSPFRVGLKHPKLSWMIMMLNKYGIAHAIVKDEVGLKGTMLYVQQGNIELCNGILTQELVSFTAKTDNFEDGPEVAIRITIDDLPDDHEFFEAQIAGQTIDTTPVPFVGKAAGVYGDKRMTVPAPTEEDEEDPFAIPDTKAGTDEAVQESGDTDDEDEWGFDDEDETPDPTPEQDEASDEAQAEVAEEKPVKDKKKKKKERKEATDPDFSDAEPSDIKYTPVTGDEFLQVDDILGHEDIVYPIKSKQPIRMYDADSSTLSAIGCKELNSDPLVVTLYARFKSSPLPYRYNPVPKADFNSLLNELIRKHNGIQEASAGSFFHWTVKAKAEEGLIKCQRLTEDGRWVEVLPKTERTKAIKERAK